MKQVSNEQLTLVAGGKNCLVDFRIAQGITESYVFTPAVMVPVDCETGKPIPDKTFTLEDLQNIAG